MNETKNRFQNNNMQLTNEFETIVRIAKILVRANSILFYKFDKAGSKLILSNTYNPPKKVFETIEVDINDKIWNDLFKNKKFGVCSLSSDKKIINKFLILPEKFKDFILFPVIYKEDIIGILIILLEKSISAQNKSEFFSLIFELLTFPFIISLLENEIKKYSTILENVTKISKAIVSNNYLKEILNLIVTTTSEIMNSKIVSLMLLDEAKQELFIEATQSLSEEYIKKPPIKVGESVSGKALKEKRPIVVLDVTKEPDYKYPEIAKKEGLVSLLSVPMIVKDKAIGVINCYKSEEYKFKDEEIKILQAVANQAAVAIENTKLMQEILATKEAIEIRKIIERAKGILMKELNIDEESAYKIIQRQSMNMGKPMKEIAEAIILSEEIKKKGAQK